MHHYLRPDPSDIVSAPHSFGGSLDTTISTIHGSELGHTSFDASFISSSARHRPLETSFAGTSRQRARSCDSNFGTVTGVVAPASAPASRTYWTSDGRSKPQPKVTNSDLERRRSPPQTYQLGCYPRFIASQLAGFQRSIAVEVMNLADEKRDLQSLRRTEYQAARRALTNPDDFRLAAKEESARVLKQCYSYNPTTAEAVVRRRVGIVGESALHVYGGVLHVLLYELTVMLAVIAYVKIACTHSFFRGQRMSAFESLVSCIGRSMVSLGFVIVALPVGFCLIMMFMPIDIALLIIRPYLSPRRKRELVRWPFPTNLAFWIAGSCGYWPAVLAHMLLGASPCSNGVLLGTMAEIPMAYRAAVVCDPLFLSANSNLRAAALKGVPDDFAACYTSKGAEMPLAVQWAYLLGDVGLCSAWEADAEKHASGSVPPASTLGYPNSPKRDHPDSHAFGP